MSAFTAFKEKEGLNNYTESSANLNQQTKSLPKQNDVQQSSPKLSVISSWTKQITRNVSNLLNVVSNDIIIDATTKAQNSHNNADEKKIS
jgi:hypothetical protein